MSSFKLCKVSMFNPNSRNSSEGVSTPFSKRKEDDAELKDITSTSKKLCTKSINYESERPKESLIPNFAVRIINRKGNQDNRLDSVLSCVPVSSIYKRLLTGVSTSPEATSIPSLEKTKPNTPKTPSHKRKLMLVGDLNSSGVHSSSLQITKKRRNNPRKVLNDITNISHSLSNDSEATPSNRPANNQIFREAGDLNSSRVRSSHLQLPKKPKKNPRKVLNDITNITESLANDKEATPSNTFNATYEDQNNEDDET
ncbi:hypothetical protein YC2023_082857 [Brassica napus]